MIVASRRYRPVVACGSSGFCPTGFAFDKDTLPDMAPKEGSPLGSPFPKFSSSKLFRFDGMIIFVVVCRQFDVGMEWCMPLVSTWYYTVWPYLEATVKIVCGFRFYVKQRSTAEACHWPADALTKVDAPRLDTLHVLLMFWNSRRSLSHGLELFH